MKNITIYLLAAAAVIIFTGALLKLENLSSGTLLFGFGILLSIAAIVILVISKIKENTV